MKTSVKIQIEDYILDCIDLSEREEYSAIVLSQMEQVRAVYDIFLKEYGHNIKYYGGEQKAFVSWMQGLPSCFNVDFENYRIIELGREWGFIKTDDQEDDFLGAFWHIIYTHFKQLLK